MAFTGDPPATTPQQDMMATALHQTWFLVVQPTAVVTAGGQPGQKMLGAAQTLVEAQAIARANMPALVIMNCVVDVAMPVPGRSPIIR